MKLIKLTALPFALFATLLFLSSCEPDAELKKTTDYQKTGIVLSGAQETPATVSPALGTMDVSYSKETRILTYTITWSGLSGAVTTMALQGLAPIGYAAPTTPVQTIVAPAASNPIFTAGAAYGISGKLTATLLADGVLVKEADLLNGMYYINIRTAAYPAGEIRGQIVFQ